MGKSLSDFLPASAGNPAPLGKRADVEKMFVCQTWYDDHVLRWRLNAYRLALDQSTENVRLIEGTTSCRIKPSD